ncbi:MAG: hypothetical protein EA341_08745 [Mongoliibacter sp.]|nr:MAG: hypothetical protein EA341_08745 [Mongoliibacter sp.]
MATDSGWLGSAFDIYRNMKHLKFINITINGEVYGLPDSVIKQKTHLRMRFLFLSYLQFFEF